jgi:Domain of unknown function (DUF4203)
VVITIKCNKDSLFQGGNMNSIISTYIIGLFESSAGCKEGELSTIWTWFELNRWAVFVLFVSIGILVTFLGRAFFKPVLFLTGVFQASFVVMLICYSTFASHSSQVWVGWVILVVSVIIGIGIGFVFIKYQLVGGFCLAAWGGFSFGLLIYNSFLYKVDSEVALWVFTVGMGLLYGALIFFFFDHVLIHATSLIGSFLVVFGIGLVAGHYTNPFTVVEMIKHGVIENIDPLFYAYLAGNVVLYILGCVWQYRQLKNAKEIQRALKESTSSFVSEAKTKVNESVGNNTNTGKE